jgi:hypothetical protein
MIQTGKQESSDPIEERMNYHSSEDCFLKVEKRFSIVLGDTLGHLLKTT